MAQELFIDLTQWRKEFVIGCNRGRAHVVRETAIMAIVHGVIHYDGGSFDGSKSDSPSCYDRADMLESVCSDDVAWREHVMVDSRRSLEDSRETLASLMRESLADTMYEAVCDRIPGPTRDQMERARTIMLEYIAGKPIPAILPAIKKPKEL